MLASRAPVAGLLSGRVTRIRMLEGWGLTRREQGELLTLSRRTVQRVGVSGQTIVLNRDQFTRLSLIVGIYRVTYTLNSEEVAAGWMMRPNRRVPFSGRTPLSYLLEGYIPALLATRRLLDADLNGRFAATPDAVALAQGLSTRQYCRVRFPALIFSTTERVSRRPVCPACPPRPCVPGIPQKSA